MAFVGNTELVIFEIGIVGLVGFVLPAFVRSFFPVRVTYDSLVAGIGWAPSNWLMQLIMATIFLVLEPLAVYRIRLLGNWQSGVNLGALVVFWILQFFLALSNALSTSRMWISFILLLIAFGLAIGTTWIFFGLDTFAGVLMIIVTILLLYLAIVSLVIAIRNGSKEAAVCYAKRQATWGDKIGADIPTTRRAYGANARSAASLQAANSAPSVASTIAGVGSSHIRATAVRSNDQTRGPPPRRSGQTDIV